jgi:hypothetical protein
MTRPDTYPNGQPIPVTLPDSYQPVSSSTPGKQNCFSCDNYRFLDRFCTKWNAPVKSRWWCEAWEPHLKRLKDTRSESGMSKRITTSIVEEHFNPSSKLKGYYEEDTVELNIPLLIRLLEVAREEVKDDAELHTMVERLIELSEDVDVLTMEEYESIMPKETKHV